MVRIGELRSHQLIEATVRAYCIRHERHAIDDTSLPPLSSASSSSSPETPRTDNRNDALCDTTVLFARGSRIAYFDESTTVLVHRIDDRSPYALRVPSLVRCYWSGPWTSGGIS
jgi:hypothetical protein